MILSRLLGLGFVAMSACLCKGASFPEGKGKMRVSALRGNTEQQGADESSRDGDDHPKGRKILPQRTRVEIPASLRTQMLVVYGGHVEIVTNGEPPQTRDKVVLLLHGAAFSENTWVALGTCELLAQAGYRVVAVGHASARGMGASQRKEYLLSVLEALHVPASDAVVVSPSMSGGLSLPLLLGGGPEQLAGYVSIAPTNTRDYGVEAYQQVTVPTMVLYGSEDPSGKASAELLSSIPDSHTHVIGGASHPCYMDEPRQFHDLLLSFLREVWAAE